MTGHDRGFTTTRRSLMLGASASLLAAGPQPRLAQSELARGTVRDDTSRGRGIARVLVSNGRDVVATDDSGRWALPVLQRDFVFVIKPPNWKVAAGAGASDRWFHLHDPARTPEHYASRFPGVPPTGDLPGNIDFVLSRTEERGHFNVALVADTQPGNALELGYVRDSLLAPIAGCDAAFAIHHGDVMGNDLSLLPSYRKLIGATGIDWHHCPGNHDMNLDAGNARLAFETWRSEIGPLCYAFQHGAATFILLNNVEPVPGASGPAAERGYVGRISNEQLLFVRNVLRHVPREQLVVVSMHVPLVNYEDPTHPSDNTTNATQLLQLLSRRPRTVSFSGHSHTTEHHYLGSSHGFHGAKPHHHQVLTAACGSWWSGPADSTGIPHSVSRDGTPRGFHILSLNGLHYTTRFVPTSQCGGSRAMRITMEPVTDTASRCRRHRVLVNVFDGCPLTEVVLEMPGSGLSPIVMRREHRTDPYVSAFLTSSAASAKPWVSASATSHIWAADLPATMAARNVDVRVTARHPHGAVSTALTGLSPA